MSLSPDPSFPRSYVEGRQRFLAAAAARGARLEHHEQPVVRGIKGEPLAADLAIFGPAEATDVVLLHSGTHGVEGFCGSGLQNALLSAGPEIDDAVAAGLRVLLLHAINPWGFSWQRRVTEDNVDLNRNFRDFMLPAGPDPEYDAVHSLLLPPAWPWTEANRAEIDAFVDTHGMARWQHAITHGQRTQPDGVFFAGNEPTWSNRTMREILRRHVRGARRLLWIDIHTGLGPTGHGEMIYAGRDLTADLARSRSCWGPKVTSVFEGSSASALVEGTIGNAAYDECPDTTFAGIALEFGTRPFGQMIDALRLDHWVAVRASDDAALCEAARRGMLDAFFVDTDAWKQAVLDQGRDAFARAVSTLSR
jgi:hypothetical protein